ncbi:inner membrane protein [Klebsiella pneumoniae]|uniref:Inner membrane protein n=4 Tax=Klebsiella pneumoniae TaxID=573 RepID=A0A2X3BXP3_KLEPN|nr:inner membrane protein [Klebsiella pneumoniae]
MKLTDKIRRDWHYYAVALGLIFILNGVVGLLGFETQGWQSYAVGLITWVISFWIAGFVIRRRRQKRPEAAAARRGKTRFSSWRFSAPGPRHGAPAPAQSGG